MIRIRLGAHYTIIIRRNPKIVLAIIEAPILNPKQWKQSCGESKNEKV